MFFYQREKSGKTLLGDGVDLVKQKEKTVKLQS